MPQTKALMQMPENKRESGAPFTKNKRSVIQCTVQYGQSMKGAYRFTRALKDANTLEVERVRLMTAADRHILSSSNKLRYCSNPGCPNKITTGKFCAAHQEEHRKYNERTRGFYNDDYNRTRRQELVTPEGEPTQNIYCSKQWKELRTQYISTRRLCEVCEKRESIYVDHIKSLRDGGEPFNHANLQALCPGCHARKTHYENKRRQGQ